SAVRLLFAIIWQLAACPPAVCGPCPTVMSARLRFVIAIPAGHRTVAVLQSSTEQVANSCFQLFGIGLSSRRDERNYVVKKRPLAAFFVSKTAFFNSAKFWPKSAAS